MICFLMNEEWLPVVGYEGLYEVSSFGQIRRIKAGQGTKTGMLRQQTDHWGYRALALSKDGVARRHLVHILVATAFHGPRPDGFEPNHINANRADPRATNLEWIPRRDNRAEPFTNGRWKPKQSRAGERNNSAKLTETTVYDIRSHQGITPAKEVAALYGTDVSNVRLIWRRKTWTHLP